MASSPFPFGFAEPQYLRLLRRYQDELDTLTRDQPYKNIAEMILVDRETAQRAVWLMVACGLEVTDRVVEAVGLNRDKVWAEAYAKIIRRRLRKGQYVPDRLGRWV